MRGNERTVPGRFEGVTADLANRTLGGAVSAHRVFAGRPLSRFVNCGITVIGANADSYDVRLRLRTRVDSVSPSQTRMRTLLEATAASNGGATVHCSSSGALEESIATRVKAELSQ